MLLCIGHAVQHKEEIKMEQNAVYGLSTLSKPEGSKANVASADQVYEKIH